MVTTEQIKELRENTGISVMQCKKALEEANGDMEKATEILKKKAGAAASKKAERSLGAGVVSSYIHAGGKVGVILEVACETDFVAKNEDFVTLANDVAMHIAAMAPEYTTEDDVTEEDRKKAEEIYAEEVEKEDKPEDIKKKILEGKLNTYFGERVLLTQKFIKDPNKTIQDLVNEATQKIGERIEIARFARFEVGKE